MIRRIGISTLLLAAHAAAAFASQGPSRLITPLHPEAAAPEGAETARQIVEAARLSPMWALILLVVSLAVSAGAIGGAFWWWRAKSEPAGAAAFRVLASRFGLDPRERSLIQRIADARHVSSAGLLVCPNAMRDVLRVSRRGAEEPARTRLLARFGRGLA
ncbi:MAG: hypothetical protein KDA05_01425 [Phycisphaerales bacterium]|nr:hypothetical protein [Phycisphaerales bacterium]